MDLGKAHGMTEKHDPASCQQCLAERLAEAMQACGHDVYGVDLLDALDDAELRLRVASGYGYSEERTDR